MTCIYQIRNKNNNKIYIGSTKSFHKRKLRHINDLRNNKHHNIYLQRCWNKTKNESIYVFEIIEKCKLSELFKKEKLWIDNKNPEYNIGDVCGGDNYSNHPEKDLLRKRLIKQLKTAKKAQLFGADNPNWKNGSSVFTCPKCGDKQKTGNKPKTCSKCRKRNGIHNPFYKKKHTKDTKEKIRLANLGKMPSNAQSITINGIKYKSRSEAARALEVCTATISNRIKKGQYPS